MYGDRQEHHAEAGGLGEAARAEGRAQDHYPQGHAGAVYDRQSGEESSEARRCPKGGVTTFSKPSAFESEIHPSHKPAVCTPGISPLRGACITACRAAAAVIQRKLRRNFLWLLLIGTAAAGKPVAK